jgi:hypothetical protein
LKTAPCSEQRTYHSVASSAQVDRVCQQVYRVVCEEHVTHDDDIKGLVADLAIRPMEAFDAPRELVGDD